MKLPGYLKIIGLLFITALLFCSACTKLQSVPAPNRSPIVTSLEIWGTAQVMEPTGSLVPEILTSSKISISCYASDADGDYLSYQWSATGGTFTGSGGNILWTAPAVSGGYTVKALVSDSRGGTDTQSIVIDVVDRITGQSPCPPSGNQQPTQSPSSQNQQRIEIISVLGPLQPYIPAGPTVGIILKNVGVEPVVSLAASLELYSSLSRASRPYNFHFYITASNPLPPGKCVSSLVNIIGGGGGDDDTWYPLTINGTLENGVTFSYTEQVQILEPTN